MRTRIPCLQIFACTALGAAGQHATPIKHEFVAIDEGLAHLLYVNENAPAKNWLVPIGQSQARDLQLIGGNRMLVGHDAGYAEFDLTTGRKVAEVASYHGVASARRLPNGHTLITGVNLGGATGVVVLELDATNTAVNRIVYPGNYVRLLRQTARGTFLLMTDTAIREGDATGAIVWEAKVDGFRHAWKAVRLPDGHTLASAGYGAFLVELDATGKIVRKFGGKEETPTAVNANFYATFQLLPDGDVVVANWQGHGPGHGSSGVQLLEFDRNGAIVWQWSEADKISSLQGVLVLDGLDPAVLHDERNGLMEPLKTAVSGRKP
ncbi:MAG TPA: hypothetical protein VMC06_15120 [Opitutaceae bacterium]|nr:hypothetical protein [Opitutaceae bacterium]